MPTLTIDAAIRRARVIAGSLLVYLAIVPFVLEKFVPITPRATGETIIATIYFVCVAEIGVALLMRSRYPLMREEAAVQQQDKSLRVRKWLTGQIVSYAIALSIALYGIAPRVLGGSLRESMQFYGVLSFCFFVGGRERPMDEG